MPKRFIFSLQPVLEHRARIEQDKQLAVAALERTRLAIEERIRRYQASITAARNDLRAHLTGQRSTGSAPAPVSLVDVRLQANASLHLVGRAHQAVLELAGVHRRLDAARLALLKAATDRKAVERLKERRHEHHKADLARRERAQVDEITVMRHSSKDTAL